MSEKDYRTTIRIGATPEVVFPYLSEEPLLKEWLGITAETKAVEGGVFALDADYQFVRGEFVAIEPHRRVVFTWGVPESDLMPPGSTTVEILLAADGDDTIVELIHSGLPASQVPAHAEGWPICLARLVTASGGIRSGAA